MANTGLKLVHDCKKLQQGVIKSMNAALTQRDKALTMCVKGMYEAPITQTKKALTIYGNKPSLEVCDLKISDFGVSSKTPCSITMPHLALKCRSHPNNIFSISSFLFFSYLP
jgi:hypothetical protein